jgi:hypothetical protein
LQQLTAHAPLHLLLAVPPLLLLVTATHFPGIAP